MELALRPSHPLMGVPAVRAAPTLYCLDDRGGWGRDLRSVAAARGWNAHMLPAALAGLCPKSYVFMRVNQGGLRMFAEKDVASAVAMHHVLIPSFDEIAMYEDKLAQSETYSAWMPQTMTFSEPGRARDAIGALGFPFLSKSRTGSASRNVRMIANAAQASDEVDQAFGAGIAAPHKLGEGVQQGYLIWQEFLAGNEYDYRVCVVGRGRMLLRRRNRPDIPFASGSGLTEPITVLDHETEGVLAFADAFFAHTGTRWCGIDVVRDGGGAWKLLETTIGWAQRAYAQCKFFGTYRKGAEIWELLCDEIEAGVFE